MTTYTTGWLSPSEQSKRDAKETTESERSLLNEIAHLRGQVDGHVKARIEEADQNIVEITALKEKLIETGRESMSRSAVIDYIRAENKQLRDLLGVDDSVKDFSVGEKLRLLRIALAQSEEEVERLRAQLKEKKVE